MERRRGAEERANLILNPAGGGLPALDWKKENRTVVVDRRLTGLLLGQTLGSAIAGAVVAGAHKDFASAQQAMTGLKPRVFKPNPKAHAVYQHTTHADYFDGAVPCTRNDAYPRLTLPLLVQTF